MIFGLRGCKFRKCRGLLVRARAFRICELICAMEEQEEGFENEKRYFELTVCAKTIQ